MTESQTTSRWVTKEQYKITRKRKPNKDKEYDYLTIVSKEEGTSTPGGRICFKIQSENKTRASD